MPRDAGPAGPPAHQACRRRPPTPGSSPGHDRHCGGDGSACVLAPARYIYLASCYSRRPLSPFADVEAQADGGVLALVRLERPLLQLIEEAVRHGPGLVVRVVHPELGDVAVVTDHELQRDLGGEAGVARRLLAEAGEERL